MRVDQAESHRLMLWGFYNEEAAFGIPFFGFSHDHITGRSTQSSSKVHYKLHLKQRLRCSLHESGRVLAVDRMSTCTDCISTCNISYSRAAA